MATFSTQCRRCGEIFSASRADAVYCSGRCRTAIYNERRNAALQHDLTAFRLGIADILARFAAADGDPETLGVLGAEAAALTPDSFATRRP